MLVRLDKFPNRQGERLHGCSRPRVVSTLSNRQA